MSELSLPSRERLRADAGRGAADRHYIVVPSHSLLDRSRTWIMWLALVGLLVWSWGPVEMFRAGSLVTDWRNMAEIRPCTHSCGPISTNGATTSRT